MRVFFDSSALVKRYVSEAGTDAVLTLEGNVLRGMDAIHIGSALALQADIFISADKRQLDAAVRSGLRVESV